MKFRANERTMIRQNRSNVAKYLIFGTVTSIGIFLVIRWSGNDPFYEQVASLKIGSEIPNVSLLVLRRKTTLCGFSTQQMRGAQDEIIVASNPHGLVLQKKIRTLNDLKGLVNISSKEAALRYVRLQTSPYLIGLWQSDNNRVSFEVMDWSQKLDRNFDYGYKTSQGDSVASETIKGGQISGFYGEVSPTDFTVHGFVKPQVQQRQAEFEIKRWLIVFRVPVSPRGLGFPVDGGDELQFVREIVKKDGEYHRYVITRSSPSTLPAGSLYWNSDVVGIPTIDN